MSADQPKRADSAVSEGGSQVVPTEPKDLQRSVQPSPFDVAPPKAWRRFVPAWLRALIWVDSAGSYDAFLSYSWKSDIKVALSIQYVIHHFLRPWYKMRAKAVFRDLSCLPAGSSLESELFDRLDRSKHLIVLASPGAAQSDGMEMEARHWFSRDRDGQILIIVTAGETRTWEEVREHSLPPSIRSNLPRAPLWISLQHLRCEILDNPNSQQLRGKLTEDLRQILLRFYPGRDWGQLRGEERSQRRRAITLLASSALLFLALAAAAIGFARYAQVQRNRALRQANIALSRQLAAQSDLLREQPSALETRVLLAVESMSLFPSVENDRALRESLYLLRKPVFALTRNDNISAFALSANGLVATAGNDRAVRVFNGVTVAEVSHWVEPNKVVSLAFSRDGSLIAIGSLEGPSRLVELSSGREVAHLAYQDGTYVVALSQNGRWVAMANKNGALCVYDFSTGREVSNIRQQYQISVLVFSPDERWIAAGSHAGLVQVFKIEGGREVSHLTQRGAVDAIAFSRNSRWVASGSSDGTTRVFEAAGGKELPRPSPSGWRERVPSAGGQPFSVLSVVRAIAFSPDDRFLATGNGDSTARIFDVITGKELLRLSHGNLVDSIAFSPDGRWIATGSLDSTTRIYETSGGKEVAHLIQEGAVQTVAFNADGRRLFTATDKTIHVYEALDGREVARLSRQNLLTTALFSQDGRWLAVKSYDGQHIDILDALRGTVVVNLARKDVEAALTLRELDLANFKPSGKTLLYHGEDEPAAFSDDGRRVAVADDDGAHVFEVTTGEEQAWMLDKDVKAVSFSPDGRWVATANVDGTGRLFDAVSGTVMFSFTLREGLGAMHFSPDSHLVATAGGDHNVYVYEVSNGKETMCLDNSTAVEALAFGPDSSLLATGTSDGTVRLFRVATGQEVWRRMELGRVSAIAFSPDGHWLATASDDRTARIFETSTGEEVVRLTHQAPVVAVAFSPHSSIVTSASYDYTVRVFEAATGRELSRINLEGRVKAVRFVDLGRTLETASMGRLESEEAVSARSDFVSVQRHLLSPGDLIKEACSRLGRNNLTEEEWKQYWQDGPRDTACSQLPDVR